MSRKTPRGNENGEIIEVGKTMRETKSALGEIKTKSQK